MKDNKFLLLLGNESDPQFHESFRYVVTCGVETFDNDLIATVKREIKEETNLNVDTIIDMNWYFEYESFGKKCIERTFISLTEEDNIISNEENIDYKWC